MRAGFLLLCLQFPYWHALGCCSLLDTDWWLFDSMKFRALGAAKSALGDRRGALQCLNTANRLQPNDVWTLRYIISCTLAHSSKLQVFQSFWLFSWLVYIGILWLYDLRVSSLLELTVRLLWCTRGIFCNNKFCCYWDLAYLMQASRASKAAPAWLQRSFDWFRSCRPYWAQWSRCAPVCLQP